MLPESSTEAEQVMVDDDAQQIVQDFNDDVDSAYGSVPGSARTGSISSAVYDYVYENGRRYHSYREGQYVLPNDDTEQERLDLQHHIWRLLLDGKLFAAPLTEPGRILDLGCGTGIWAIDVADEFPSALVFGIDLSPIQPHWVPPNCFFHVDDYDGDWTYREEEAFNFIHGRALSGTTSNWPRFYSQAYQHLRPGGYVEMQEYDAWVFSDDNSWDQAPCTREFCEKLDEASISFNKRLNVASYHKQWMIDAGFEDVQEIVHRIPIGPWARDQKLKELGRWERLHMQMSVASHVPALFTRVLGYSPEQVQALIQGVKTEFQDPQLHLITQYRFTTGRRPTPQF